jgi:hypothetical protein
LIRAKGDTTKLNSEKESLPPGKYLVKAYVDLQHRLTADPATLLRDADFYGQTELQAEWREGFPNAQTLSATQLKK